ncbi:MAG: SUMF1/EgtB/PvdO family nonheme iron enzyme [Prevotellaceae bacterium]|jgi:formylglycine-generating enzyme required for sulfatase activity|nr:SUMF1/EgtB/PvdO family nonheme iron enzyme [Prevotellaceae bacterium]
MDKYDIFISYRRLDVGGKAEHLKDLLESNYKVRVSFDRENLTGIFDVELAKRIDQCKDFLLVIGAHSFAFEEKDFEEEQVALYNFFASCTLEEFEAKIRKLGRDAPIDFVRIEIARALHRKVNIIPIVPERTKEFSFSDLDFPSDIVEIQRHNAVFYSNSPDALFKDIIPKIRRHLTFFNGKQPFLNGEQSLNRDEEMVIDEILTNMVKVEGGRYRMGVAPDAAGKYDEDVDKELETPQIVQDIETFWIAKYETSVSEWHRIMGGRYDKEFAQAPIANVSYDECTLFAEKLSDLTGLDFQLPTEAEWEYAARGGIFADTTKYAGSNNPDSVAWYSKNSGGYAHVRNDNNGGFYCNNLDLYDMSGNVSEWCNTDFRRYSDILSKKPDPLVIDPNSKVIRGGNYDSEAYGITVYHREPMNVLAKAETVGFRLITKTMKPMDIVTKNFTQEFTKDMQAAYDACMKMSISIGSGSQVGLQAANKAFKECNTKKFGTLRCLDAKPLSLDGHFVFDEVFVDSLIDGRNVYKFAQQYASGRAMRSTTSSGYILTKNGAVRKLSSAKYSFPASGQQELAVVAEAGGLITLRVHDKTNDKWYIDTVDVKKGQTSRTLSFSLPENKRSLIEIEIINTTNRDISFVVISN